jgi:vancomycin resistance protein YoaR
MPQIRAGFDPPPLRVGEGRVEPGQMPFLAFGTFSTSERPHPQIGVRFPVRGVGRLDPGHGFAAFGPTSSLPRRDRRERRALLLAHHLSTRPTRPAVDASSALRHGCLARFVSTPPMPSSLAPRPEGHRLFARLAIAAGAGVLLGAVLISSAGDGRSVASGGPLRLYGQVLPSNEEAADRASEWASQRFEGWFNLELPDGERRRIAYAALGVQPDLRRLRQTIRDAQSGIYDSMRPADVVGDPALDWIVPVHVERDRLLGTLLALKGELDRMAIDARLDLDHEAVIPARPGRRLDVDRTSIAIERALERGADGAPLEFDVRAPARVATELANIRHDALLGFFETAYDVAARAADRTFNLQLAASKLDGTVLMPGGELDFNAVVGPRDEASGYRVATLSADGEPIDGIGAGVCQISGTLHAAALFAGLDVIERHPHTRPTSYIKLGFDAAVAHPSINLRLRNPYDFPVVLRETVAAGRVRAEIRGARRPHTITVLRRIDAATPFEELERPDATLPRGERVLAQRGVPGIDLHRYRIRRDGEHSVRQVVVDHYPPTPQVTRVGIVSTSAVTFSAFTKTSRSSSATATGRPPQDPSPEYLTDELWVMTQNAQLDGPFVEQRVPGRFGVPGWTKDIGAPAWKSPR